MGLSEREKKLLFWASFIALAAAGVGFVLRVMLIGQWSTDFKITGEEAGVIFGMSLWPIAFSVATPPLIPKAPRRTEGRLSIPAALR